MRSFIAKHENHLFTVLVIACGFVMFFGGRYLLQHVISVKVHSDICRSKPDVQIKHAAKLWSRNE